MITPSHDVSVVLVGAGGYGNIYLSALLNPPDPDATNVRLRLIAAVDPNPSSCKYQEELQRRQIPIYPSMEEMASRHSPDLVALCSPPHIHCEQTVKA